MWDFAIRQSPVSVRKQPRHRCQMWRTLLLHIHVVPVYWIYDMCSRALLTMLLEYPISPAPKEGKMVNKHFSQTEIFVTEIQPEANLPSVFVSPFWSCICFLTQGKDKNYRRNSGIMLRQKKTWSTWSNNIWASFCINHHCIDQHQSSASISTR